MVKLHQVVFSLLSSYLSPEFLDPRPQNVPNRSIAIIGAGSAGLPMLKSLVELPEETRQSLDFVLFEEREDVGGVWLPDPNIVTPPRLPETPLYPRLRTNTPVPTMTYPGFPFPPGTPLFPSHQHILAYHRRYASRFNLYPHIRFNHRVLKAHWVGTSTHGQWNITLRNDQNTLETRLFDHLVIASGNNHIPRIPTFPGQDVWLSNTPSNSPPREILHSIYYRYPDRYANRSVLVVGGGASGRDATSQIFPLAKKTYLSLRHEAEIDPDVEIKPSISHFTTDAVVFVDGSSAAIDSVLLATGYQMRKPFLEAGHAITADPSAHGNNTSPGEGHSLITNLKYIFPLHKHILSLCASYPPIALAFIGLPSAIANCPSDYAQSQFVTQVILKPDILPSREELLKELAVNEEAIREKGFDPYDIGHRLLNGTSSDYQDGLIEFLKSKKTIPSGGKKYVEHWRRDALSYSYLRRGWIHIEELGKADEWLAGVETEEEWASLMKRVNAWQEEFEKREGIPFVPDFDLAQAFV